MIASQDDVQLSGGKVFGDYFLTALNNYDEKDEAACRAFNHAAIVGLVRARLYSWYSTQDRLVLGFLIDLHVGEL